MQTLGRSPPTTAPVRRPCASSSSARRLPCGRSRCSRYAEGMATANETIQVGGIRCERCVMRLAHALEGHDGLESANANLMGQVTLAWDAERTSREAIVERLAEAGFPELAAV